MNRLLVLVDRALAIPPAIIGAPLWFLSGCFRGRPFHVEDATEARILSDAVIGITGLILLEKLTGVSALDVLLVWTMISLFSLAIWWDES